MFILKDYQHKHILPPDLASLYTSRTIILVASGFLGLFLPGFLLINIKSLELVLLYYLIGWGLYLFLVAPGAMLINKFGIKAVFTAALPVLALYYATLYFLPGDVLVFTVLSMLVLVLYRMLYWVPYHTEFASLSQRENRGKQLGLLDFFSSFLGIIIPLVSGFLIKEFGFQLVFVIVIILIFTAMIPLRFLPRLKVRYSWSYKKTWQEFFSRKNRKMMLAYMGDGAENWVVKMFITTAFQIFLASTYHNFALILLRTPLDALMYEKAADSGHYVDEYSTLREMFLQLGRVIVIVAVLLLLRFLPLNLVFFLAAIASLLVNLLPHHGIYEKTGVR